MISEDLTRVLVYLVHRLDGPLSWAALRRTSSTCVASAHPGRHVLSHCLTVCLSTRHPRVPLSHAPHLPVTPVTLVTSNSSNRYNSFCLIIEPTRHDDDDGCTLARARLVRRSRACALVACAVAAMSNSVPFTEMRSPRSYVIGNVGVRLKKTSNVRNKHDVSGIIIGFFSLLLQMASWFTDF